MGRVARFLMTLSPCTILYPSLCTAQVTAAASAPVTQQPLPPATKLEAFKPAAGTVVTIGYDELGRVGTISVDAREHRDARGGTVRGLVVDVRESEYRKERAFVDVDEIPELLKGIDALLAVMVNPTSFKNFEVRYTTRGDLQLTAFNTVRGDLLYAVQAGRITKAQSFISKEDVQKLRAMFVTAQQKLGAPSGQ